MALANQGCIYRAPDLADLRVRTFNIFENYDPLITFIYRAIRIDIYNRLNDMQEKPSFVLRLSEEITNDICHNFSIIDKSINFRARFATFARKARRFTNFQFCSLILVPRITKSI